MANQTSTTKSNSETFDKDYEWLMQKSSEFSKYEHSTPAVDFGVQQPFKKYSLYQDCPNSITSFNTNAVL